jgi:hypothetical protein
MSSAQILNMRWIRIFNLLQLAVRNRLAGRRQCQPPGEQAKPFRFPAPLPEDQPEINQGISL